MGQKMNTWFSLILNFFYTNGSLSRYLYPVLLNRVTYLESTKSKSFGGRWDFSFKKWCVNFDNPNFQNVSLDVFHPCRNGEFVVLFPQRMMEFIVTNSNSNPLFRWKESLCTPSTLLLWPLHQVSYHFPIRLLLPQVLSYHHQMHSLLLLLYQRMRLFFI